MDSSAKRQLHHLLNHMLLKTLFLNDRRDFEECLGPKNTEPHLL